MEGLTEQDLQRDKSIKMELKLSNVELKLSNNEDVLHGQNTKELIKRDLQKDKLIEMELKLLREEMLHVQKCQIDFLVVSITTTALILGYVMAAFKQSIPASISIEALRNTTPIQLSQYNLISQFPVSSKELFLIPLCILLPVWCIIIYKARTVNRIRAYIMVIEDIYINGKFSKFIGWESSMNRYRRDFNVGLSDILFRFIFIIKDYRGLYECIKSEFGLSTNIPNLAWECTKDREARQELRKITLYKLIAFPFRIPYLIFPFRIHGYWELINSIFIWVTLLCLVLAGFLDSWSHIIDILSHLHTKAIILIVLFVALINLWSVYDLAYGNNTVQKIGERWQEILNEP